jgi:hypothetical protein
MKQRINFFIVLIFIFIFSGCEDTGISNNNNANSGNGKTGILFDNFGYNNDNYTFKYIPKEDREHFKNLISEEMGKYPDGYFKIIGSYKICLVRDLIDKRFKTGVGGFTSGKNKTIFINVAKGERLVPDGSDSLIPGLIEGFISKPAYYFDSSICKSFHHEMQHLAEYSLWKTTDYYWTEYEILYTGSHINTSTTNYTIDYNTPIPYGFISHYAELDPAEDRAEIMGHWLAYNGDLGFISAAKEADILDKKIVLLFTLLRDRLSFPDPLTEYNQKMGR